MIHRRPSTPIHARLAFAGTLLLCLAASDTHAQDVGREDLPIQQGRFVWQPDTRVRRAETVFPSPHDPDFVLVSTRMGLVVTRDGAQTWEEIPDTGRAELGWPTAALFAPTDPLRVLLGTKDKGMLESRDGGKSWRPFADKAKGLADDRIDHLIYYPGDPTMRTLYATHGEGVAGISKSIDGGKTWFVIAEKYYAGPICFGKTTLFVGGGLVEEGDVWALYRSTDAGRYLSELVRDARPAACVAPFRNPQHPLFAVNGGRLVQMDSGDPYGPEQGAKWRSLFSAMGEEAGEEVLYAYDPYELGVLASRDNFKTWTAENRGLFVGKLVKDGANLAASANGRTLYASVNGQLYVARRAATKAPYLQHIKAQPASVELPFFGYLEYMGALRSKLRAVEVARNAGRKALELREQVRQLKEWGEGREVAITARVRSAEGLKRVELNLSPLLGSSKAEMFDDGKHGDGAAGDGVYGVTHRIAPRTMANAPKAKSGMRVLPGQVTLELTAIDQQDRATHGLVLFSAYPARESRSYWDGESLSFGRNMSIEGDAEASESEVYARSGDRCLKIQANSGPWMCGWGVDMWQINRYYSHQYNISDQDYLTFWIKVPNNHDRDVFVALQDGTDHFSTANRTNKVWLLKEKILEKFTGEYQKARVPMASLMPRTAFFADLTGGFVFGGEDPKGHLIYVDDIGFEVDAEKDKPKP